VTIFLFFSLSLLFPLQFNNCLLLSPQLQFLHPYFILPTLILCILIRNFEDTCHLFACLGIPVVFQSYNPTTLFLIHHRSIFLRNQRLVEIDRLHPFNFLFYHRHFRQGFQPLNSESTELFALQVPRHLAITFPHPVRLPLSNLKFSKTGNNFWRWKSNSQLSSKGSYGFFARNREWTEVAVLRGWS
jgi:hypothetical protein